MTIDKKRVIEVVNQLKSIDSKGMKIDWKQATHILNQEFQIKKSKDFYRSIYRRETKDPTYHANTKPTQDENIECGKGIENIKTKRISVETGENGTQKSEMLVDIVEFPLKTPNDIMELHGYDVFQWELVNHKLKLWNVYSKQDGTTELYSSAVTVKPLQFDLSEEMIVEIIDKVVDKHKFNENRNYEVYYLEDYEPRKMAELCIFDLHFGKFAWKGEAGEDYDVKIAKARYLKALDEFLSFIRYEGIEKILLPFGNDFFTIDNDEETTTKGTKQDIDTRLPKIFELGVDLILETIEKCLEIAPVEFVYIKSNHDAKVGYYANVLVDRLYKDNPNVILHTSPLARKYIEYGNCLIGYTHGNKEGKRLETVMQSEVPEMWGRTKYREWHIGHLHHRQTREHNGFTIEVLPSISGTDKYHYESGYIGALQRSVCMIWNYEKGKEIERYINI